MCSLGRSKLWAPAGAFLLLLLVLDPGVLASRHSEPAHAEIDSYSSGEPHQRRTGTPAAASLPQGLITARAPPMPPVRAQALTCPSGAGNVVNLAADQDLYAVAKTAGKMYQLDPGNYTISSPILLTTAETTCYRGIGLSKNDVIIFLDTGSANESTRAFQAKGGAILGLENLVVDGQGQHPGVEIGETANLTFTGTPATLYATDVTFQRCLLTWSRGSGNPYGGAAILAQNPGSRVELTRAELLDNTCSNCHAGGLEVFNGPVAVLEEVKMLRNSALNTAGAGGDGGALQVVLATLTIKGNRNVFLDNTAFRNGGALSMEVAIVLVEGDLCASGNTAAAVGGFASVIFSNNQLTFGEGSIVTWP